MCHKGTKGVQTYCVITSALEGGGRSAPRPGRFTPSTG